MSNGADVCPTFHCGKQQGVGEIALYMHKEASWQREAGVLTVSRSSSNYCRFPQRWGYVLTTMSS
jgi:hypothetical protein